MNMQTIQPWLDQLHSEIDHILYERKQEFLLALVVILSGENLHLAGEQGSGRSFFKQLLSPLLPFVGDAFISEQPHEQALFSLPVTPLSQPSSFLRLAQERAQLASYRLSLPDFSLHEIIHRAREIPLAQSVQQILLETREVNNWSAKHYLAYLQIISISALYNGRQQVVADDLLLLRMMGLNVVLPSEDDEQIVFDRELQLLELELENQQRQQQSLRKLRHFHLMIKGQESQTCRFLYEGEESHMLLSAYQQLLIHRDRYIGVQFYQPGGYGLAPRPFKESFKLSDDFTLMDTAGRYYELLTEQVLPTRRISHLSRQYLQAQLDAILQKMFEHNEASNRGLNNCFICEPQAPIDALQANNRLMERIKVIKAKLL